MIFENQNYSNFFCFTIHNKTEQKLFLGIFFFFFKILYVSPKKTSFVILCSEVWQGGFQLLLILGLLGMYFDVAMVFVTKSSLLFRLDVAILCCLCSNCGRAIVWVKTNDNNNCLFYNHFWPFFCQLYVYLSQKQGSDGHFKMLKESKS